MNAAYTHLAQFYDRLMDEDTQAWAEYLLTLASQQGLEPSRALDLGCGTGSISLALAQRGLEVVGIDLSPAMIAHAEEKANQLGCSVQFLVQDMRRLELPHQSWELVVAACDALNYLTTAEDFRKALEGVYRHLCPGGLFLFDLNSEAKLKEVYGSNSYAYLHDDFAYFWDNHFCDEEQLCTMQLTFFVPGPEGAYLRVQEQHVQRLWLPQEVEAFLTEAGFELVGWYEFLTFSSPSEDTHRWQFAARKALR